VRNGAPVRDRRRRFGSITYFVLIEHSKASARELGGIAMWKELLVDAQKAELRQLAVGTILPEAFVPVFYLLLGDCKWPVRASGSRRAGRVRFFSFRFVRFDAIRFVSFSI
jgi:hypothetical protein